MISQQVNKEIKDNAAQLLSVLNFRGRITIFSLTNSNLDVEFIEFCLKWKSSDSEETSSRGFFSWYFIIVKFLFALKRRSTEPCWTNEFNRESNCSFDTRNDLQQWSRACLDGHCAILIIPCKFGGSDSNMEASRPRRKQVSSCCQNSGCQRPPNPNHDASILHHLLCNLFVDWRRDSVLHNCVHLHHVSKLVFCYRVYNVPAPFPGSYKAFVLQKPSYICESAEDSDSRSVMALRSPYSSCYGLRKVSFVQ